MATPGTYVFATADEGKPVVVTFTAQSLTGYSPNLTPVYALTDADFVDEKGNKDPVQVERADVFSLPTIQRIEVLNRGNQYAAQPVEARDQSQIEIFGPRVGPTITAHEICDPFVIGPIVAQAILQRELYVRTKFTFKLSWEYCLLDPMDVITITDVESRLEQLSGARDRDRGGRQGASRRHLRGVRHRRLDAGILPDRRRRRLSAEPRRSGRPGQPAASSTSRRFRRPAASPQIWVGASGATYGASTQWGGANVYVSVDGVDLFADRDHHAGDAAGLFDRRAAARRPDGTRPTRWRSTSPKAAGRSAGTSQAAAQAGATMSLVDSELIAYETATLTSGERLQSDRGLSRCPRWP